MSRAMDSMPAKLRAQLTRTTGRDMPQQYHILAFAARVIGAAERARGAVPCEHDPGDRRTAERCRAGRVSRPATAPQAGVHSPGWLAVRDSAVVRLVGPEA